MMKKAIKITLIFLLFAIPIWLFGKPIGINVISNLTYFEFRSEFDKTNDLRIALHIDDWSWQFGGTFGLAKLNKLKNNQQIAPEGQELAKEIYDHISSGKHLEYLKIQKEVYQGVRDDLSIPRWPVNVLNVYLYDHDIKRLQQKE